MSVSSIPNKYPAPQRLYDPGDPVWQVNREMLLLFNGARAVLLEIAHPLVAQGVASYSGFKTKPMARLKRTLRTMIQFSFGDTALVDYAAKHMVRSHARVKGELTETVGDFNAGTRYHADDPHLRLWVWATLVDGIFMTHDRFVRPLTIQQKRQYYIDSQKMLPYMGVPDHVVPPTLEDFNAYVTDVVCNQLAVGSTALEIKTALFSDAPVGRFFSMASQPGIGMLPPHIRDAFGFEWNTDKDRRLDKFAAAVRAYRRVAPAPLVIWPQALKVEWSRALSSIFAL